MDSFAAVLKALRIVRCGVAAMLMAGFSMVATPTLAAASKDKPLTLDDFVRQSDFLSAKISPDGQYVAVTYWHEDVVAISIIGLADLKATATLWFPQQSSVADYWWVSDDRVVVAIAKGFGMLDQPYLTGELYGMNADGSHQTYLFGYEGKMNTGSHIKTVGGDRAYAYMVDPLPDEPNEALIKVVPWDKPDIQYFYRLNVLSGQRRVQGTLQGTQAVPLDLTDAGVVADAKGRPRYALVQRDNLKVVEEQHLLDEDVWQVVHTYENNETIGLLGISADGHTAYLVSDEGGGHMCLRSRNIDTGALTTLSCNPEFDTSPAPAWADVHGAPLVAAYETDKFLAEILKPDSPQAKIYTLLEKTFPGQRIRITSETQDGKQLLVFVDGGRNPGDYYTLDTTTLHANYLFSRRQWIDPDKMSPVEPITLKARDGQVLHGYVTAPHGAKPEARPMIVMPHGGPHGLRDEWNWQVWPQYFASLGYAVLQVNYRGSGGYGDGFESAGYGKWGSLMQDDITDAVQWAIKSGITQSSRICIMGASWGGYAALMGAEREPDLYRCAVSYAGVYDLNIQREKSDTAQTAFGRAYLDRVLGTTDEQIRDNSPITYVDRLKAMVLISHGTADERVPFKQAEVLRAAMDRLHKPYEWLPLRGEEHGFYSDDNQIKFLRKATDMIVTAIGPGVPATVPVAPPSK